MGNYLIYPSEEISVSGDPSATPLTTNEMQRTRPFVRFTAPTKTPSTLPPWVTGTFVARQIRQFHTTRVLRPVVEAASSDAA